LLEVSIRKAAPPWAAYCVGQREAGRYHRTDPRVLLAEDAVLGRSRPAGSDIVARIVAQWLTESLRQPFVVENRAGAAGNIAAQAIIGSQPDGYRLLVVTTASAINATLCPQLPFNFLRDVAPVARLVRMINLVVVHPSVPANTLAEFIAPVIEKSGIKGSL
jgi:tripartite-type tricarboxylate transporter receptor subunit TctC